jgi:hypothetical protein
MSFTSVSLSSIPNGTFAYLTYDLETGFKLLEEIRDQNAVYFRDLADPDADGITNAFTTTAMVVGSTILDYSASMGALESRVGELVKIGDTWATVLFYNSASSIRVDNYPAKLPPVQSVVPGVAGIINIPEHNLAENTPIRFASTIRLPIGLSKATYYVRNPSTNSFSVSLTSGGTPVEILDIGSGELTASTLYSLFTTTLDYDSVKDTIVAKIYNNAGTFSSETYFRVTGESITNIESYPTLPVTGDYPGQLALNLSDGIIYTWNGTIWVAGSTEIVRSPTAPENPTLGQLWFRTTDSLLFSWDGAQWVQVISATPGTRYIDITLEPGLYVGELVTNSVDDNLYRWDGTDWILVSDSTILDLSNEAHTIPTDFNNTSPDFTGAETTVRVYSGGNDVTNLWTLSASAVGVTGAFGNGTNWPTNEYRVNGISADAAYVDFTATRGAYTRTARFTISLARGGADGTPATVYRVVPSVFAIKELLGAFTPSTIRFDSYLVSSGYTSANSDFKIYTSTNGVSFTEISYANDHTDVSFYSLTVPTTNFIRVELYEPGTSTLRDLETVPIISDGEDGNSGSTSIRLDLSNENASILTDVNGNNINLSDAVTTVRVYEGITEATGWTITVTPSANVTVNNTGNIYSVTAFTGTTGFVDFTATKSGFSSLTARFSLIKVTSGNIYKVTSSVDSIIKNALGNYIPSTVTFSSEKISATGTAAYLGRFIIATSTNGTSFTTAYTSATDESSTVYTIPANIISVRVNLYLAGGITTLVDSETIPVVTDGTNGVSAQYVVVNGEQAFKFLPSQTVPINTTITLSASLFGGLTTYDWEYWTGSAWANLSGTQNASTYSLAYNNAAWGSNNSLRVRCLSGTQSDEITIVKLFDGTNALSGFLTNESFTAPTLSDGTNPNFTGSGGTFKVFSGVTDVTGDAVLTIVGGTGTTTVTRTLNGLTMTLTESNGAYLLSGTSWSSDVETFTLRATYAGATIDKIYSISKAKAGINGTNGSAGINAKSVSISETSQAVEYTFADVRVGPSSITFTATAQNVVTPFYRFFVDGTAQGSDFTTTNTFVYTTPTTYFSAPKVIKVEVREGSASGTLVATDQTSVFAIKPGANTIVAILSNEAHTVPANSDGSVISFAGSGTTIKVYEGVTELTYETGTSFPTIAGRFRIVPTSTNISAASISGSGTTTATVANATSMTADAATISYLINVRNSGSQNTAITKVQSFSKSKTGNTGGIGPTGPTGAQARIAYAIGVSNFAFSGAVSVVKSGDTVPASGDWGLTTSWNTTPQTLTTSGTSLYQVTGLYNPTTNQTTWEGYPYLSALKVGQLSAISASMGSLDVDGTLTIGTTGKLISSGTAFNTNGIFLGYDSTAYKFSVGNGASKLTYDGTTLTLPSSTIGGDVNKFSPFRSLAPTSWTNAAEITFLEVDLPASTHPEGHKPFAIGTGYMEGDDDYSYRFKMYMRSSTAVPLILGTPASAGSFDDGKGNFTYFITYNSFVSVSSGSTLSSTGKSHLVYSVFFDAGVTTIYYSIVSGAAFTTSDSITATPSTDFVLVSETRHRPFGNFKTNFAISGSTGSNSTGIVTTKFTVQRFNVQDTSAISSSTGADAIIEVTGILMGVR